MPLMSILTFGGPIPLAALFLLISGTVFCTFAKRFRFRTAAFLSLLALFQAAMLLFSYGAIRLVEYEYNLQISEFQLLYRGIECGCILLFLSSPIWQRIRESKKHKTQA
ncbi:hypothetical protein DB345_12865 [Spartobacteria bacterium LR76]|nr:hypothetical protein DB345_12865 [Spartobacteria bacterium LR76]